MKHFDILKKSLLVSSLCVAGTVNAQVHPLAFGSQTIGGTATPTNWYADYVGLRLEVVSPNSIAGDKGYKAANDGDAANTSNWGGLVPPAIINTPIIMPQTGDSLANTTITTNMTGKVALIYRGLTEFGEKAVAAQAAGAIAIIIVNNIGGGPVGMAAGSVGANAHIPVYMISKADGDAMDAQYCSGIIPNVTITGWGQNFTHDLGFVPGGIAGWHDFAIPVSQLTNSGNPFAYKMIDGAFVANYGSAAATNVKVTAALSFTPTNGATTQIHADSSGVLASFPVADSVYSFFAPSEYDLPTAATTTEGRFDLNYNIAATSAEDFPFDNSTTYSFYTTANTFSKGRYDLTGATPQPIRTIYESFNSNGEFLWGPMYYITNANMSLAKVQYSLAANITAGNPPTLPNGQNNVYLFKWVDGWHDSVNNVTYPQDSIVENGELVLVSLGIKIFDQPSDTSDGLLEMTTMGDTDGNGTHPNFDANSWYYMAVDVPATCFLGADGVLDPYPRTYGRYMASANGFLDYANIVSPDDKSTFYTDPNQGNSPIPVPATAFLTSVDSFNYNNSKGLIPSVAMLTGPYIPAGVKNTAAKFANVSLYPNPAVNSLTVAVELQQPAKTVTYEIIDGLGRFVSKEVVSNVQNEKHVIDTKNLAPGNYYLIFSADSKILSRKFTVAK